MTISNHITGGIVFTGSFCSLFGVNIFENKYTIITCLIASILPDIDHTKSLIGKLFYPISKWIATNYGHRTITHSFIFFFFFSISFFIIENSILTTFKYSLIFSFALFSHLILDMITISGVPLFYPFSKNPCVIPANPDLRIRTGNLKSEGIILLIEHIYREYSSSNNALEISYNFKHYGENKKGTGTLLKALPKELKLIDKNKIVVISKESNTIIKSLKFRKKDSIYNKKEIVINQINLDSLNKLLKDKYILKGQIFSNLEFNQDGKKTNNLKIKESYNSIFFTNIEKDKSEEIEIKNKLQKEYLKAAKVKKERVIILNRIKEIKMNISKYSNYEKDKKIKELKELKKSIESMTFDKTEIKNLNFKKNNLKVIENQNFSGIIEILEITETDRHI